MMDRVEFEHAVSFFGFSNVEYRHRLSVEGEKLWNLLFKRDLDFGGWFIECTGLMGRGKTSLMLTMVNKIIREYPKETIFWREAPVAPLQCAKLGDNFELFVERKQHMGLYELGEHNPIPSDRYKIRYFKGVMELIKMVRPGQLNVVYFQKPTTWVDLMFRLRFNTMFQSLFIDEMEDVTPARCRREDGTYWSNDKFASHLKELRKCRINITYNTQSKTDIDWRVRSKVMLHAYLPGSRVDDESPIWKNMLQGLSTGEAVLDLGFSLFGKITFDAYRPKKTIYSVFPTDKRGRISRLIS